MVEPISILKSKTKIIVACLFLIGSVNINAQNHFHDFIKDYESLLNQYVDPALDVEERILFKQEIISMFKDEGETVVYNDLRSDGQEYIPISEYLGNLVADYPSGISIELKNVQDEFDYDTNRAVISFESYYNNDRKATLYCLVDVVLFSKEKFKGEIISVSKFLKEGNIFFEEEKSFRTVIDSLNNLIQKYLKNGNSSNELLKLFTKDATVYTKSVTKEFSVSQYFGNILNLPYYSIDLFWKPLPVELAQTENNSQIVVQQVFIGYSKNGQMEYQEETLRIFEFDTNVSISSIRPHQL